MSECKITPLDFLYRRFPISDEPRYNFFYKIVNGEKKPTSAAFKTKKDELGLSVDIAKLSTPESSVLDYCKFGLCKLQAKTPIDLGHGCKHDPLPENNAHSLIVGDTNRTAKKIANAITHVFEFEDCK